MEKGRRTAMLSIVFICTGNTCRSPMAEWISKQIIAELQLQDHVRVSSAGVAAWGGSELSEGSKRALLRRQLPESSAHLARLVDEAILAEADLVLTMAESHRRILIEKHPQYQSKIYNLLAYATGNSGDIADPFGGDDESYEQAAKQIEAACRELLVKIEAQLGKS
jgi:protein-tyrosine-phosphatase